MRKFWRLLLNHQPLNTRPLLPQVGVLALVPDQWSDIWMVRHHVMTRLADYFSVVWVNPANNWRDTPRQKTVHASDGLRSGFTVYKPERWLPDFYRPKLALASLKIRLRHARKLLLKQGCTHLVAYLWRPEFISVLPWLGVNLTCYHLEDEYTFSTVDVPLIGDEARLISEVDQVFILSPTLMTKKGNINPHTAYVPGGVDADAYSQIQPQPADLARIPQPRIGYTGHLKKQLDWQLLSELASNHPEWQFVFVGPVSPHVEISAAINILRGRPNVHFLGSKTARELVPYPQHFDVCIMPYQVNDYTKYIYPLKLHEYLAAGRPTIGSPIAALQEFSQLVTLANTKQEWEMAIRKALSPAANTPQVRSARLAMARNYDWNHVVGAIARVIAERLGYAVPEERKFEPIGSVSARA